MEAEAQAPSVLNVAVPAAEHIAKLLVREGKTSGGLRIRVSGGGCSGLSYLFELEGAPQPEDLVIEAHGARVYVDPQSLPYLKGSYLTFLKTVMKSSFKLMNPNAVAECSCGESFAV